MPRSIGHFQLLLLVSLSQSWSHQSCMVTGSWRLDKGYGVGTWISWLAPRKRLINVIRKHDQDIISLYFLHFCQSETGFSGFMFPTSTFQGAGHGGFLVGSCGGVMVFWMPWVYLQFFLVAGIVYYKLKDFGAAVNDLQECVVLDPKNKFAYNYLVSFLIWISLLEQERF
jgi:hypothetical protein